jgi:hypothetical protein
MDPYDLLPPPSPPFIDVFNDPLSFLYNGLGSEYPLYEMALMPMGVAFVGGLAEQVENFYQEMVALGLYPPLGQLQYAIVDNATSEAQSLLNENGPCTSAVNKLLGLINNAMGTNFNINSLLNTSNISLYFSSSSLLQTQGENGNWNTVANTFATNPYQVAITSLTMNNKPAIFLGSNFFNDPNIQAYTLIHEWFHGLDVDKFTDQFLAGLLGWTTNPTKSATAYLSSYFANNCGLGD